jgi:hypothetical protein
MSQERTHLEAVQAQRRQFWEEEPALEWLCGELENIRESLLDLLTVLKGATKVLG